MTVQIMTTFLFILVFSTFGNAYADDQDNSTRKTIIDDTATIANLTDNDLWSLLLRDCKKPSLSCVRDNIQTYLNNTFNFSSDVQFTNFLKFAKNANNYDDIARAYHSDTGVDTSENPETHDDEDSPIQEMSRSLQDGTVKFLMTHDLEFDLPEPFFQGSVLKISPRSLDDTGAMVKVEVVPKTKTEVESGRTIKKIRKFISERLIYALLALLLVIKLLAVKFLFILPLIIGAAAAKKLLIKVLLFLFPALHHLFKFCAYYPTQAKFHHHKHLISHVHTVAHPHKHGATIHGPPVHGHHDGVEVIGSHAEGPPNHYHGGHVVHDDHTADLYDPYQEDLLGNLYPSVPGLGNDILSHRNDPEFDQGENEITSWGQSYPTTRPPKPKPKPKRPLTPSQIEAELIKAEKEALIKAKLQKERKRIHEENLKLQDQLIKAVKMQEKLKQHAAAIGAKIPQKLPPEILVNQNSLGQAISPSAQILPPNPVGVSAHLRPVTSNVHYKPSSYSPQQHIQTNKVQQQSTVVQQNLQQYHQQGLSSQDYNRKYTGQSQAAEPFQPSASDTFESPANFNPVYQNPQNVANPKENYAKTVVSTTTKNPNRFEEEIYKAASITYDKFYSPILEKIDRILQGLGFNDEPCRERLVCSMYKNPANFSPHSNLLSAELSRDPSELQKPTSTNAVVIRFYKYVQAARDGQDGRDCLRLYPACAINTDL